MSINKEWHLKNKMPKNPTLDQRIEWHIEHSKNCDCRPLGGKILEEIKKEELRYNNHNYFIYIHTHMNLDIKEYLKQIRLENEKTIPKLIELKEEFNKSLDEQIEKVFKDNDIVKRVKFPKIPIHIKYFVSAPFIYSMIIPSIIVHIWLEIYHQVCFRLYDIPLVNYKEYFIYDRQLLSMLNPIEKINCIYCSYVNNLFRYASEIGGRTERYWCPIKYYRRINNAHSQYDKFIKSEDLKDIYDKWEELRDFSDLK